ncbi:HNH endonuclease [Vreelandella indica]|uniref:HNH endonuclease n=1 Tax=Vreelandella indica TaxID=3126500 RepID=UPI00300DC279
MSKATGAAIARVKEIDPQEVRKQFNYNAETGELIWRERDVNANRHNAKWNKRYAHKPAGHVRESSSRSYINVRFMGSDYAAHRIIWAWVTGENPPWQIDHEDGDSLNNAWINLRDGTGYINNRNSKLPKSNSSGFVGVVWSKQSNKWHAQAKTNGKVRFLGAFNDINEAAAVSKKFRLENDFSERHGERS